jgi:hypothetical protein
LRSSRRVYLVLRRNWLRREEERSVAKDLEMGFLEEVTG